MSERRWLRRLNLFDKISNGLSPPYLADHILQRSATNISLRTRNLNIVCRTERYENSFFPFCIKQRNRLDESIRSLPSISRSKTHLLKFVRPPGHSFFGIRDRIGSKLLSQIRVEFTDLRDQRFNHKFNCASPTCKCDIEDETPVHYLLCCPALQRNKTYIP